MSELTPTATFMLDLPPAPGDGHVSRSVFAPPRPVLSQADLRSLTVDLVMAPARDRDAVLSAYDLTPEQFTVHLEDHPVVVATRRHIEAEMRADPNYSTRTRARAALAESVGAVASIITDRRSDSKEVLAAVRTLSDLASATGAGATGAGSASARGRAGVSISLNFGGAVGQQLQTVVRVDDTGEDEA